MPPCNCKNDKAIMTIIRQQQWTKNEITSLNETRLFLQTYWLSDIIDPYTLQIHPFFKFQCTTSPSSSTLIWPKSEPPTQDAINLWNRAMNVITSWATTNKQRLLPIRWNHVHLRSRKWNANVGRKDGIGLRDML